MNEIKLTRPDKNEFLHPWKSLEYILGEQIRASSFFTGKARLFVSEGALRDKGFSQDGKEKFKERVTPWLMQCANITDKRRLTGWIKANYNRGYLGDTSFQLK